MDLPTFAQTLLQNAKTLLPMWYPAGKWVGPEFKVGNIHGEPGQSLSINSMTGVWVDFADPDTPGNRGGDLVALYAAKRGLKQGEAAKELGWSNGAGPRVDNVDVIPITGRTERACEPIPDNPPDLPGITPTALYKYGSAFWVARYEGEGGKSFKPWTWRAGKWTAKGYPAPRPLYGLELLAEYPARAVLLVEGEKCADAARTVLGKAYNVLTWSGGANGVAGADWGPLYGQQVDLWPDADEPGVKAVASILERLAPHIIKRVRVLEQTGQPDGWDIADAIAGGWGLIECAAHVNREGGKYIREIKAVELRKGRHHDGIAPIVTVEAPQAVPGKSIYMLVKEMALQVNTAEVPHPTVSNVSLVIQRHPELQGKIWFDTFRHQIRTTLNGPEREWTDADDTALTVWIQQKLDMHKVGTILVQSAVEHAAHCRPINSVTSWLGALTWDGEARLDTWVGDCLGVELTPYSSAVGRNWLISMVARAYRPGNQCDHMPVLEGKMGTGKSSLLALLGNPWYSALPEAFGSKDFFQAVQGQWLIEVPDMTGFSKRDHSHIIAVITTRTDRYRASYGRRTEDHPRQCIFTATSETDDYLQDSRGIRRYWPLRCTGIDLEALNLQREQLFAEAVAAFKSGATWHEMPGEAIAEQLDRRNEDPWREKVLRYVAGHDEWTSTEILEECCEVAVKDMNQYNKNRIAAIMREDGWRNYVTTRSEMRLRVWTKRH